MQSFLFLFYLVPESF